jgi:membrane fusion protein (multidrug efflux system)
MSHPETRTAKPAGPAGAAAEGRAGQHGPSEIRSPVKALIRGLLLPLLTLSVTLGVIAYATTHWGAWIGQARLQTTDDAQIRADTSRVASRISGTVRLVAVADFQHVCAGDLLAEIDPADYAATVAKAEADLAAAEASRANLDSQIALQRAVIEQAGAATAAAAAKDLEARQELARQTDLLRSGNGTRQRTEQAVSAKVSAAAQLRSAQAAELAQQRQLDVLFGNQRQQAAAVAAQRATLHSAQLQLGYTRIVAPVDGVVSERLVQLGNYVATGTALISVVPLPQVHVIANYKETQLTRVAVGQPVTFTVDALPGSEFNGQVERIAPASGAQFALLPPDNATGNFTKVVQRIAVRIAIEAGQPGLGGLRPGMSVVTTIRTDGGAGPAAAP